MRIQAESVAAVPTTRAFRKELRVLVTQVLLVLLLGTFPLFGREAAELPEGVKAVWDLTSAFHELTPTRERICLNGLWLWQPTLPNTTRVPSEEWGYFKVPGCWPGITDYMQKDCQTLYVHPSWSNRRMAEVSAAWYERDLLIPANWSGRRITLRADCLNSLAQVYLDGTSVGEIRFPGGELEITPFCRSGTQQRLSLLVVALPLKGVLLSYTDSASAREVKGAVARRGLCGDVFIVSTPISASLKEVNVRTSVRQRQCVIEASVEELSPDEDYKLRAVITSKGQVIKDFTSKPFRASALQDGHFPMTLNWCPDRLWDIQTPDHTYEVTVSLLDFKDRTVDTAWKERFGFREFWINGRDFFLNGSRLFLSAVPLDNAEVSAATATYESARESLNRLKSFGINYVYAHNYGCEPGSHLQFEEILRAADDVGMLVGLSQPHFSHYDWKSPEADRTNGYALHADYYVHVAHNHPSVVMYPMSHNATGYDEDMNPDMIDGIQDARDSWARKNSALALRAEAIVKQLDPSRIVYHHASGNLGVMHDSNFYPNFAPIQELSDWFEHWSTAGIKPAFTCEYGAPFTWDWTMYRGWYRGQREFGSAAVPWEFCLAEWNAQFFGDRAFAISEPEKANLRWEAKQFRAHKVWHRWDYPFEVGSPRLEERYPVFAAYLTDNWRAFRTWGVSATSPWEYGHFWKLRDGTERKRQDLKVAWNTLQRPGFSPDYLDQQYERLDLAFERQDWIETAAAQALLRSNQPLLAYLGGNPNGVTGKDHNFFPGEAVEKQVVIVNNSRQPATCDCEWTFGLPSPVRGHKRIKLDTGEIAKVPFRVLIPKSALAGSYPLTLLARFNNGETQSDAFKVDVLRTKLSNEPRFKIALFDPNGETRTNLARLGVATQPVQATDDLSSYDFVVIGKGALTVDGPAPDLSGVRQGLRVLVFEQTTEALENRLGFRVQEYGLRQVFARVPDHPALAGLSSEELRDWRGQATITAPRLKYQSRPRYGPTVEWCGVPVTRVWRCGNRGNVASVLIEKPACGDFLPVIDGGFSLQFSPLMEYREEKGLVLFCQLDVTGRTEPDPAGDLLVHNLLQYVGNWKPSLKRQAVYLGNPDGHKYLQSVGINAPVYDGQPLSPNEVMILGPHSARTVDAEAVKSWLRKDGSLLAIALTSEDARAFLPFELTFKNAEHISCFFEAPGGSSALSGIGPADVHNRDPRELPLVTAGANVIGDGVLGEIDSGRVVFCQLAPWQFEDDQFNVRRTHRRTAFLLSRLLANMGVAGHTPLLQRFSAPVRSTEAEKRYLAGLYIDRPEEWDDPYRFFRW